jgi:acetolactate synthase-1/2/3 large subunit
LSELKEKMQYAFSLKDKLVFLDIAVDKEEHVYPMAIRGGAMSDMYLSKTERS